MDFHSEKSLANYICEGGKPIFHIKIIIQIHSSMNYSYTTTDASAGQQHWIVLLSAKEHSHFSALPQIMYRLKEVDMASCTELASVHP